MANQNWLELDSAIQTILRQIDSRTPRSPVSSGRVGAWKSECLYVPLARIEELVHEHVKGGGESTVSAVRTLVDALCQIEESDASAGAHHVTAFMVDDARDLAGILEMGTVYSDGIVVGADSLDGLEYPGVAIDRTSAILTLKLRLEQDEGEAFLMALARMGVSRDDPDSLRIVEKIQDAAMVDGFDMDLSIGDAEWESCSYHVLLELAHACENGKHAVIAYRTVSNATSGDARVPSGTQTALEPQTQAGTQTPAGAQTAADSVPIKLHWLSPLELHVHPENDRVYLFALQHAWQERDGYSEIAGRFSDEDFEWSLDRPDDPWTRDERIREFRVDRIVDVAIPGSHEKDESVKAMQPAERLVGSAKRTAKVRLHGDCCFDERIWQGAVVLDNPDASCGEACGDIPGTSARDSKLVEIPLLENTSWIARSIASRMGRAEVVEPTDLAQDVRKAARDILDDMDALEAEYRASFRSDSTSRRA